jgi:Ca2+-binding RTX toxin-like protein
VNPEFTLGSQENDIIKGGASRDIIGGGLGNDILWGGGGKDVLTGNGGKDTFVFNTKSSKSTADTLKDFAAKDDTIWIDNALLGKKGAAVKAFKKGTELKPLKLKSDFFAVLETKGDKMAKGADDYMLYNKADGKVYYDVDGAGGKSAVQIATVSPIKKKIPLLTQKDFFFI